MYNVLSVAEVRAAEQKARDAGASDLFLRTGAALATADGLYERAKNEPRGTAVFCGPGGNGADGILAAAMLRIKGCDINVYTVGNVDGSAEYLAYAKQVGVGVFSAEEFGGKEGIYVDAIFGIGLNKHITGETADLIERLNCAEDVFRFALDIPSGLNADTGEIMGVAFRAHITMTFIGFKTGMLFGSGRDCCGRMIVENIGIEANSNVAVCTNEDFKPVKRKPSAHKGVFGKIFIIGGSGSMLGAPIMSATAAHAAYLNGAGTVTLCLPEVHRVALSSRSIMAISRFLGDTPDGFIRFDKAVFDEIIGTANVIAIGMGMGKTPELKKIVEYLAAEFSGNLIIDADALNALGTDAAVLNGGKATVAITPHVGEFRRLTGKDATIDNAVELAKTIGGTVVLKSATTIITDGERVRINITGTPAMAKGGTGDVLSGSIAGLACSMPLFDAAVVACYRNGIGAERAVSSFAELMLTPRDILKMANYPEL